MQRPWCWFYSILLFFYVRATCSSGLWSGMVRKFLTPLRRQGCSRYSRCFKNKLVLSTQTNENTYSYSKYVKINLHFNIIITLTKIFFWTTLIMSKKWENTCKLQEKLFQFYLSYLIITLLPQPVKFSIDNNIFMWNIFVVK